MRYLHVTESKVEKRFTVCYHGAEKKLFSSIKAGLSWPTSSSPGFYCLLGEEYRVPGRFENPKAEKGKLILLADHESKSPFPDKLFDPLTDDCTLFHCDSIYTDLKNHEGDVGIFRDWMYDKNMRVDLVEAPFSDSFGLGVSLIRRWADASLLELPEGSLREQLKKLTAADLEESPETRFYAVNALRFVVSAFEKYRPPIHISFNGHRVNNFGPTGWMLA